MRLLRTHLLPAALLLFTFVALLSMLIPTVADPDLWGHVRYGLDMLDARTIIRTDPYSYLSEPGTWINHEWLAEVSFALAYRAGGSQGLVLLKVAMGMATAGVVFATLRRRGVRLLAACAALLVVVAGIRFAISPVRPQLFTALGFACLLWILTAYETRPRALYWSIPVLLIWTNAHGGFLAGVGFLGVWYATQAFMRIHEQDSLRPLVSREFIGLTIPVLLAVASTLLNPYGLDHWRFLMETATVARPEITDWQPLAQFMPLFVLYWALILLGGWALIRSNRPRSVPMAAIWVVSAILALMAVRHLLFFVMAWAVMVGEHLDAAGEYMLPARVKQTQRGGPAAALLAIATLVVLTVMARQPFDVMIGSFPYPVRAVALLHDHIDGVDMVTPFNWGQYILWHLGPENRVSLDGRRETVYTDEIYLMNLAFMTGRTDWDALLEVHPPDLVFTDRGLASHNLMMLMPDWALVYEDPLCGIFVPLDSALRPVLEQATPPDLPYDGAGMVFP